jgi:hypothetical protein
MDPQAVLALCHEHAAAEAELATDRILATLVAAPRFEYFPLAKSLVGWTNIERLYRDQYPKFVTRVVDYELLGEWTSEHAALQEYVIAIREDDESATAYHVMSMMPVDGEAGLLTGERLYCDEKFVQALLGSLCDLLEPIAAPPGASISRW